MAASFDWGELEGGINLLTENEYNNESGGIQFQTLDPIQYYTNSVSNQPSPGFRYQWNENENLIQKVPHNNICKFCGKKDCQNT